MLRDNLSLEDKLKEIVGMIRQKELSEGTRYSERQIYKIIIDLYENIRK